MFISSKEFYLIYLNNPKAGCTSIKNWIHKLDYGYEFHSPLDIHSQSKELLTHYAVRPDELIERMRQSFVFTFVRHPLRRAHSLYCEKICNISPYSFKSVREIIKKKYGANFFSSVNLEQEAKNFFAFLNFIRDVQTNQIEFRKDPHWMPQINTIKRGSKVRSLDFIGRIETFEEDFYFICKKAGLPHQNIPHYNKSPKPQFSYEQILNDEIRILGELIYAEDLFSFAYKI